MSSSSLTPATSVSKYKDFTFPKIFDLPPFFTLQPIQNTRLSQNEMWCDLILSFTRHFKIYELDVAEAAATSPLFRNDSINRRLSEDGIREMLDILVQRGQARWENVPMQKGKKESKSKTTKNRATLLWRTPAEWASLIHKWANDIGKVNEVMTMYDLREGQDSEGQEFYQLQGGILMEALEVLVEQEKAVVFESDNTDAVGVKFFQG